MPPTTSPEPATDTILVEDALPVVYLTMNRPAQRNALSTDLMKALTQALTEQSVRPECRVIVLRGAGSAFSAGHDLREMLGGSEDEERAIFAACTHLMQTIQGIAQPVIASVHGIATAAGCQLVASCDLAIACEGTRFATPGVKIGLFCATPMVALTRDRPQARTGDAADRPDDRCRDRGGMGADQPRCTRRPAGRRSAGAGATDRRGQPVDDPDRQASVLPADRSGPGDRV